MRLRYLGHSCFQWILENGVRIVSDPYTRVGYSLPTGLLADVITISHEHFDHNYAEGVVKTSQIVRDAGAHTDVGFPLVGIESAHDGKGGALRGKNTIYKFCVENVWFCHLGDLGEAYSERLAEQIGDVDVLLIPVGGTYTIDARQAAEYVRKLAPKVVIPMHYRPKDGTLDIDGVEPFLKEYSQTDIVRIEGEWALDRATIGEYFGKIVVMDRMEK